MFSTPRDFPPYSVALAMVVLQWLNVWPLLEPIPEFEQLACQLRDGTVTITGVRAPCDRCPVQFGISLVCPDLRLISTADTCQRPQRQPKCLGHWTLRLSLSSYPRFAPMGRRSNPPHFQAKRLAGGAAASSYSVIALTMGIHLSVCI